MTLAVTAERSTGPLIGEGMVNLAGERVADLRSYLEGLTRETDLEPQDQIYGDTLPVGSSIESVRDRYGRPDTSGVIIKPDRATVKLHNHFAVASNLSLSTQDDRNGFLPDDHERATRLIDRAVDRLEIKGAGFDGLMRRDIQKCLTRFRTFARKTEHDPEGLNGLDDLVFGFCLHVKGVDNGKRKSHTHPNCRANFCKTYRGVETYVDLKRNGWPEELGTRRINGRNREVVFRGSEIYFKGGQGWNHDLMLHHKNPVTRDGVRDTGVRINLRIYAQLRSSIDDLNKWAHGPI